MVVQVYCFFPQKCLHGNDSLTLDLYKKRTKVIFTPPQEKLVRHLLLWVAVNPKNRRFSWFWEDLNFFKHIFSVESLTRTRSLIFRERKFKKNCAPNTIFAQSIDVSKNLLKFGKQKTTVPYVWQPKYLRNRGFKLRLRSLKDFMRKPEAQTQQKSNFFYSLHDIGYI